jgi:hypothetical protein
MTSKVKATKSASCRQFLKRCCAARPNSFHDRKKEVLRHFVDVMASCDRAALSCFRKIAAKFDTFDYSGCKKWISMRRLRIRWFVGLTDMKEFEDMTAAVGSDSISSVWKEVIREKFGPFRTTFVSTPPTAPTTPTTPTAPSPAPTSAMEAAVHTVSTRAAMFSLTTTHLHQGFPLTRSSLQRSMSDSALSTVYASARAGNAKSLVGSQGGCQAIGKIGSHYPGFVEPRVFYHGTRQNYTQPGPSTPNAHSHYGQDSALARRFQTELSISDNQVAGQSAASLIRPPPPYTRDMSDLSSSSSSSSGLSRVNCPSTFSTQPTFATPYAVDQYIPVYAYPPDACLYPGGGNYFHSPTPVRGQGVNFVGRLYSPSHLNDNRGHLKPSHVFTDAEFTAFEKLAATYTANGSQCVKADCSAQTSLDSEFEVNNIVTSTTADLGDASYSSAGAEHIANFGVKDSERESAFFTVAETMDIVEALSDDSLDQRNTFPGYC